MSSERPSAYFARRGTRVIVVTIPPTLTNRSRLASSDCMSTKCAIKRTTMCVWASVQPRLAIWNVLALPTATKVGRIQNVRMDTQTSVATILEFPATGTCESWVPRHGRRCNVDEIEFHSLKLIQHHCNDWVTYGDGRAREVPANAARESMPLMTCCRATVTRES